MSYPPRGARGWTGIALVLSLGTGCAVLRGMNAVALFAALYVLPVLFAHFVREVGR